MRTASFPPAAAGAAPRRDVTVWRWRHGNDVIRWRHSIVDSAIKDRADASLAVRRTVLLTEKHGKPGVLVTHMRHWL